MTVEPGKGGQELIPNTIQKIKDLNNYIKKNNLEIDIEADGGINPENVAMLKDVGVNIIVAGSSITNSNNFKEVVTKLKA